MCSEECDATGEIIWVAAGNFARVKYMQSQGVQFNPSHPVTPEMFVEALPRIRDFTGAMDDTEAFRHLEENLKSFT
jgi:hypothetical protein